MRIFVGGGWGVQDWFGLCVYTFIGSSHLKLMLFFMIGDCWSASQINLAVCVSLCPMATDPSLDLLQPAELYPQP